MPRFRTLAIAVGLAAAVGFTSAGVVAPTGVAAAAAAPVPQKIDDPSQFVLREHADDGSLVRALEQDKHLSNPSVHAVVNDPRNPTRRALCHPGALGGVSPAEGFCWSRNDDTDCHYVPQGITASWDAVADPQGYGSPPHQVIVVSWYHKSSCRKTESDRSRITIADWDATYPDRYADVLLVEPTGTVQRPSFKDVPVHAGGVAWYGDYLYLADTTRGLRVFDMRDLLRVNSRENRVGVRGKGAGAKYAAHGLRWVLPQVAWYEDVSAVQDHLRWSTIAVDRETPSLVMAEFQDCATCARAVRFPLDRQSHRLTTNGALVTATGALRLPYLHVQGVVAYGEQWWFASGKQERLFHYDGDGRADSRPYPSGVESLTYWHRPNAPDLIWSLQEPVRERNVFAVQG